MSAYLLRVDTGERQALAHGREDLIEQRCAERLELVARDGALDVHVVHDALEVERRLNVGRQHLLGALALLVDAQHGLFERGAEYRDQHEEW